MFVSRFVVTAFAITGFAASASAADLSFPAPSAFTPAVYDWSGFYGGVHAGGDFGGEYSADFTLPDSFGEDFDSDGFLGGGQIGFNHQFDQFVIGIEADWSFTDIDGDTRVGLTGLGTGGVDAETNWISTIRGRAGYAFDRVLVYGTAGVAFADVEVSESFTGSSDDNVHTGYVVGAGLEAALTERLSARAEYLYTDFGEEEFSLAGGAVTGDADASNSIFRIGINYRFGSFR